MSKYRSRTKPRSRKTKKKSIAFATSHPFTPRLTQQKKNCIFHPLMTHLGKFLKYMKFKGPIWVVMLIKGNLKKKTQTNETVQTWVLLPWCQFCWRFTIVHCEQFNATNSFLQFTILKENSMINLNSKNLDNWEAELMMIIIEFCTWTS